MLCTTGHVVIQLLMAFGEALVCEQVSSQPQETSTLTHLRFLPAHLIKTYIIHYVIYWQGWGWGGEVGN